MNVIDPKEWTSSDALVIYADRYTRSKLETAKLLTEWRRAIVEHSPVKIGDVVKELEPDRTTGRKRSFRVVGVDFAHEDRLYYRGQVLTRDGSWGEIAHRIYTAVEIVGHDTEFDGVELHWTLSSVSVPLDKMRPPRPKA